MRLLSDVNPTPEQLVIVSRNRPGLEIIRGAAGSGKTTTALLRLKSLIAMHQSRRQRLNDRTPIRILVLTYNRTLRGYLNALAKAQISSDVNADLTVSTFAKWAKRSIERNLPYSLDIIEKDYRQSLLIDLLKDVDLMPDYAIQEIEYLMGRFLPDSIENYFEAERTGRGLSPRVERQTRVSLIRNAVQKYQSFIDSENLWDWNDLAVRMANHKECLPYDIIIIDEAQDFSANQLRAVRNHLNDIHNLTFVLDTTQRIYARGYTWKECGFSVRPEQVSHLSANFRNTRQIAKFAASLLVGLQLDDDGSMPDFDACERDGPKPVVLTGLFGSQLNWCLDYIKREIDLNSQSVAFIHPKAGGYFKEVRARLTRRGLRYVEIKQADEWPEGPINIGLTSMHSAKGLEFDHVMLIGLNRDLMECSLDEVDDRMHTWRKLLAMAIGRAKESVVVGYKRGQETRLVSYFDPDSFDLVKV